jgi:hypothetical protein
LLPDLPALYSEVVVEAEAEGEVVAAVAAAAGVVVAGQVAVPQQQRDGA